MNVIGRAIGVDLGSKRIGIAICDDAGLVATPHETIKRIGDETVEHGQILTLLRQTESRSLVIGLPLDLDGNEGPAAQHVQAEIRRIGKKLRNADLDVEIFTQDERLSTVTANRSLAHLKVRRDRRKEMVDQLAAATILQTWLDGSSA